MTKLRQYFEDGTIMELVKAGFVAPSKLNYPVYVQCVTEYMQRGMTKTEAVMETSIKCKVCESTVWKSIKVIQ